VTLRDALERARENDAQFRTIAADAESALEDRVQAKSSLLPALSHTTQYLGTQSNDVLPRVDSSATMASTSFARGRSSREISARTWLKTLFRRAERPKCWRTPVSRSRGAASR
jgi:hypothetical protein